MQSDTRPFWKTKTFWAAVTGILGVITTVWAFAIDGSPAVKAIFATIVGVAAILQGVFIADRIKRISGGKEQ